MTHDSETRKGGNCDALQLEAARHRAICSELLSQCPWCISLQNQQFRKGQFRNQFIRVLAKFLLRMHRNCYFRASDQTSDTVIDSVIQIFYSRVISWCQATFLRGFPRCVECQRGLAMRKVFVRPSVLPSFRLSVKRVHC